MGDYEVGSAAVVGGTRACRRGRKPISSSPKRATGTEPSQNKAAQTRAEIWTAKGNPEPGTRRAIIGFG